MVEAEHALPGLIRIGEMRAIYDLSPRPTVSNNEVREWFWNTNHTEKALLAMVAVIAARRYPPLSAATLARGRATSSTGQRRRLGFRLNRRLPRHTGRSAFAPLNEFAAVAQRRRFAGTPVCLRRWGAVSNGGRDDMDENLTKG